MKIYNFIFIKFINMKKVHKIENFIIVSVFCTMIFLSFIQVFMRYVLKIGILWGEEFILYLFILLIFMAAPIAYRKDMLINMTFFIKKIPLNIQKKVNIFSQITITIFLVIFIVTSLINALQNLHQYSTTIGISKFYTYIILPISGILFLLEVLYKNAGFNKQVQKKS